MHAIFRLVPRPLPSLLPALPPLLLSALLLGAMLTPQGAQAQTANSPVGGYGPRLLPSAPQPNTKQDMPAAVPGSQTEKAPVIQSSRLTGDMSPNDALFDAINRGDIATARDALNRGADLSARNVLGMTPMDLSVDLGRDDITFVLLSMRGTEVTGGPSQTASAAPPTRATTQAPRPVAPRPMVQPVRNAPAPAPAASDPGTPNPQAGFLGFGGR